jgi:type II secretory pathway pseudopilin PulG
MRLLARLLALAIVATAASALAQDFGRQREQNALHDMARAQERQADELRRLRQIEGDRARREENDRVNAKRDARSMRRFDRP